MGHLFKVGQICSAVSCVIANVQAQVAQVATGGCKLNIPGAFQEPTILTNVTPDMDIANAEVFGPVLSSA